MLKVVNFFGGPGSGKSTMAAAVYSALKWAGVEAELVTEYAKELVYDNPAGLENQFRIAGEQYHRIYRLVDKVEVAIVDSPLLLSIVYAHKYGPHFKKVLFARHAEFDNLNFFLKRTRHYSLVGREHTEMEAEEIDKHLLVELGERLKFNKVGALRDSLRPVYEQVYRFCRPEEVR